MFHLNKVEDILLLKTELQKAKARYREVLKQQGVSLHLQELRRKIKVLLGRINVLESRHSPNLSWQCEKKILDINK